MIMKLAAKDIMNPHVVSVTDTMDLREVAKIFMEEGITGAPVVDEMGHLVGVISQSDLVEYELAIEHELTVEARSITARTTMPWIPAGASRSKSCRLTRSKT
jgi:Mg/Co/Ni transporter MgtE